MKFTLSWLKEHLDTDESLEKLADKLTMIGLEVESIEDKAKALAPFSIARVISSPIMVDRKSTRLNSSHLGISYAVFCLKKKTKTNYYIADTYKKIYKT